MYHKLDCHKPGQRKLPKTRGCRLAALRACARGCNKTRMQRQHFFNPQPFVSLSKKPSHKQATINRDNTQKQYWSIWTIINAYILHIYRFDQIRFCYCMPMTVDTFELDVPHLPSPSPHRPRPDCATHLAPNVSLRRMPSAGEKTIAWTRGRAPRPGRALLMWPKQFRVLRKVHVIPR